MTRRRRRQRIGGGPRSRIRLARRAHPRVSRRVRSHARSVSPKSGAIRASIDRARSNGQIKAHRPQPATLRKRREALHRWVSCAILIRGERRHSRSMASLRPAYRPRGEAIDAAQTSGSPSTRRRQNLTSLASGCVIFRTYRENSRPS